MIDIIKIKIAVSKKNEDIYQVKIFQELRCIGQGEFRVNRENSDHPYNLWRKYYDQFYTYKPSTNESREKGGSIGLTIEDLKKKLKFTEAELLKYLSGCLQQTGLLKKIKDICDLSQRVIIYFECQDNVIENLPWEYCLSKNLDSYSVKVEILRLSTGVIEFHPFYPTQDRNCTRILAIAGDDLGLTFDRDLASLKQLNNVDIELFGKWPSDLIFKYKSFDDLLMLLEDKRGWDIIYFAGHSGTDNSLGGFLKLENRKTFITDIEQSLSKAVENGLQFVFFNSCEGISCGNQLIELGVPQVLVMREKIYNDISHEFLDILLKKLEKGLDVNAAVKETCHNFSTDKFRDRFPSAFLIPSLFSRDDTISYKLKFVPVDESLYSNSFSYVLSNRLKLSALILTLITGIFPGINSHVIDAEQAAISIFRTPSDPSLVLLHIDRESLDASPLTRSKNPKPINRQYLANSIDRLAALKVKSIAIDYVFHPKDDKNNTLYLQQLNSSIKKASNSGISFLLANDSKVPSQPLFSNITKGDIEFEFYGNFPQYIDRDINPSSNILLFSYALARKYTELNYGLPTKIPRCLSFVICPIIDYSQSPDSVYTRISARHLFDDTELEDLKNKIVLIAPGGYKEAGVEEDEDGGDNYPLPLPIQLTKTKKYFSNNRPFTGGEIHAYIANHLITDSFVMRISDLLVIVIAVFASRYIYRLPMRRQSYHKAILIVTPIIYTGSCIVIYSIANLAIPFILPLVFYTAYNISKYRWEKYYG
jgi:CHASE2 domain-containing sensor protein